MPEELEQTIALRSLLDACCETLDEKDRQLQSLRTLVQDWQNLVLLHEELNVMSIFEIDDWCKAWEELKRRTSQLLSDEQKEG